jgi:superfamily II DNA or RNA helicase
VADILGAVHTNAPPPVPKQYGKSWAKPGGKPPAKPVAANKYERKQDRVERSIARYIGPGPAPTAPPKVLVADLTKRGLLVDLPALISAMGYTEYSRLQQRLTLHYVKQVGKKTKGKITMHMFIIHTLQEAGRIRKLFAVARFSGLARIIREICPRKSITLRVRNCLPPGEDIPAERCKLDLDLTDNQRVLIQYMMANIYTPERQAAGSAGCTLVMDTGTGKTYTTIHLIVKELRGKTAVIVPSDSVIVTWEDALQSTCPHLRVGYYTGKRKEDGDIVLMIINSALSPNFTVGDDTLTWSQYYNRFRTIVYDEIHNYPTGGRSQVFWRASLRCLVGLTATPDERLDEMDKVYTYHVGRIINAKDVPGYNVKDIVWKGAVRQIHYSGPPEHTKRLTNACGTMDTTSMVKQFAADPYRNRMVLEEIYRMAAGDRDVFVFAEHREYLQYLYELLRRDGKGNPIDVPEASKKELRAWNAMTLMGGSTKLDHQAAQHTKIILVTYAYAKEGISIVKMNAILYATPRRNKHRQILGRILRRGGDPSIERWITDIVDAKTTLRDQAKTRGLIYAEKGFPVEVIKVPWTQYREETGDGEEVLADLVDDT